MRPLLSTTDYYGVMLFTHQTKRYSQHGECIEGAVSSSERAPRAETNKQSRLVEPGNRLFNKSPAIGLEMGYQDLGKL